ncbi:Clp protease N-terminal domain-containing protein, partial [Nocardioides sp. CF8]|uniref:Clp protease N-terminal domain-containing protein n=2 Tax=Nocardioides TaxID=1839 RepID=UPI002FBE884A
RATPLSGTQLDPAAGRRESVRLPEVDVAVRRSAYGTSGHVELRRSPEQALRDLAMFRRTGPEPPTEPTVTPAARDVLGYATTEAVALNHHYVGTEHVLLGLLRETNSDAAQILASHTDLKTVRAHVRQIVGVGAESPHEELPLTPRAAQVLVFARREADMYRESLIAPEHLLLGILREGEGIATQVLLELRVDFGMVRAATSRSLRQAQAPGTLPPDEPQNG